MPEPAPKYVEHLAELNDISRSMTAIQLRRIENDARQALARERDMHEAAQWYAVLGLVKLRARDFSEALKHFRNADRLHPNFGHRRNVACLLIETGSIDEALDILVDQFEAESPTDSHRLQTLLNLSEAFYLNGQRKDAADAFSEAMAIADVTDARTAYVLSAQAALIGADAAATELFARFLSLRHKRALGEAPPIAFIDSLEPELLRDSRQTLRGEVIFRAVDRFRRFGRFDNPRELCTPEQQKAADDATNAVFEETRAWRARANDAVLRNT